METFDREYAEQLRKNEKYDGLFNYCSSFPDDDKALCCLAVCHYNGYGTDKNTDMAFYCASKSSGLDRSEGKACFALCCLYGFEALRDEQEGIRLLNEAVNEGSVVAMRYLGDCYRYGRGVEKNNAEAVEWYRKAVDAGDSMAMGSLGYCYNAGIGVKKDEIEAVKWYRKAADAGDSVAMRHLGYCYKDGKGVEKDEGEAVKWYRKAANAGDSVAMRNLGICYENGTGVKGRSRSCQMVSQSR